MGCLTSCNRAQNWRAIVSLLIDQGLSSGANNVSHPRTATWRTRTCLRDACVIPDAASLHLKSEEGAGVSLQTIIKNTFETRRSYRQMKDFPHHPLFWNPQSEAELACSMPYHHGKSDWGGNCFVMSRITRNSTTPSPNLELKYQTPTSTKSAKHPAS